MDWETLRRVANTLCPKTNTRTEKQKPGGKSGDNLELSIENIVMGSESCEKL